MAIYHLSVKTISRAAGRSATAAAAYRAGVEITDERTGEIHDYRRKGGVESSAVILPADAPEWAADRAALWNAAEQAETRKNSTVAREFEIALPAELSPHKRQQLAFDFARELVDTHGCAADVAIHAPSRGGDSRNHHAHILLTTRRLTPEGFTEKTRELDSKATGPGLVTLWRERFAMLQTERLHDAGLFLAVRADSLEAQGIDREPTQHLGPAATGYERRTGQPSENRLRHEAEAIERQANAKELERQGAALDRSILDLAGGIEKARQEAQARAQATVKKQQPRLAELPIADQVQAWESDLAKAQAAREQRLARVSQKVETRYERRSQALDLVHRTRPEAPTGLLAMFKRGAYEQTAAAWRESFTRARRLEDQAATLRHRVDLAWAQAKDWAYDKLRQKHPELAQRVSDHYHAERLKQVEARRREREAREAKRGRGKGHSR